MSGSGQVIVAREVLEPPYQAQCSDAAIRGLVFCLFLALMVQKELADLCQSHGLVNAGTINASRC